jgi:DNA-directed RNA polymerase specialized sigma24 family protein
MEPAHLNALLAALRDQLIDDARLVGGFGRRRRRRELLARVQAILDVGPVDADPIKLPEDVPHGWAPDARLSMGDRVSLEIDPERLAAAIAELPLFAREVFTLHCRDSLDYSSIAARLAISQDAVRRELAAALIALDRALNIQPDNDAAPIA